MRSIAEIDILEKAHTLGAPSLGIAAEALYVRWQAGLRDQETFIRLAFLSWYGRIEPTQLTGLVATLPSVDELIQSWGGLLHLCHESKYVLAALATEYPWCLGDELSWTQLAVQLPEEVSALEPTSVVYSDWRYIFGLQNEPRGLRKQLAAEFHARFHGRGYMGTYVCAVFGRRAGL